MEEWRLYLFAQEVKHICEIPQACEIIGFLYFWLKKNIYQFSLMKNLFVK